MTDRSSCLKRWCDCEFFLLGSVFDGEMGCSVEFVNDGNGDDNDDDNVCGTSRFNAKRRSC